MSTVLALLLLAGMAASGLAVLWRWRLPLRLAPLEVVAFGIPLGVVWSSLALLALAYAFGFNAVAVWLVVAVSLGLAVALSWADLARYVPAPSAPVGIVSTPPAGDKTAGARSLRSACTVVGVRGLLRPGIGWVPIVAIGAFAIRWASLWDGALTYERAGLFAGHVNIWGDWAQHIGDVNSFVSGDNFPPEHPRYTGVSYAYHYLASFTAAAMVEVGMGVTQALTFHSFLFSIVVALGVYAFARRLTGDPWSAALGMTLFFLGGGFAWLLVAERIDGPGDIWNVLRDRPWDGAEVAAHNYEWQNVYFASIEPQRAFLYGLPLCLLTFTLLHSAVQVRRPGGQAARRVGRRVSPFPLPQQGEGGRGVRGRALRLPLLPSSWPVFAAAGAVAGLLPFAHLGPLPLVAMVCLCLFALFPGWGWVVFGAVWVALTVPQLVIQGDGGGETFASFRAQIGWVAEPDSWLWFWWKNVGLFLPLLVAGFLVRGLFSPASRRFLWAFMPVFVVANLYVFQPDPWDNTKLLTYWFLAGSIVVGAVLVYLWRLRLARPQVALVRAAVVAATISLTLSGLLLNLNQAEGHDRYLFLTQEELDLAARVRAETPADALFAVGLQHNHPVPVMSGRRVVMSYPGWLWPRGIDSTRREADLRAIYTLTPLADALIDNYTVTHVVIGPWEIQNFGADPDSWRQRYPVVIETANYLVFAVRP